jgi:RNA polymerase sigma factor (sigma-70 family)
LKLDRSRFDQLYRMHAANAFRRATRVLGNDADAHEVVHDVFLSLFERPEQFASKSQLSTFLYSAVTHACLNRLRSGNTRRRLLAQHAANVPQPTAADAPADQTWLVRRVLERVPAPLGELAVYYYVDELTHAEIAEVLGCSRRHVGDLLQRLTAWVEQQEQAECGS